MPHKPNLSVQLSPQELQTIRELAQAMGLSIVGGVRSGEGSPRRLLIEIAHAAQQQGTAALAQRLKRALQTRD